MAYRVYQPWMLNHRPQNVNWRIKRTIRRGVNAGLYVTATTNGVHTPTSWHYKGKAVDMTGSWQNMVRFQIAEWTRAKRFGPFSKYLYLEVFGPDNYHNIKNGRPIVLGEGTFLENLHDSHVHIARP